MGAKVIVCVVVVAMVAGRERMAGASGASLTILRKTPACKAITFQAGACGLWFIRYVYLRTKLVPGLPLAFTWYTLE